MLMISVRIAALSGLLLLAACDNNSTPAEKNQSQLPTGVVALSPDEIAHLGIHTAPARQASYTPVVQGYGVVIGFDTLAQADSEVATAEAAAQQSQASLARQVRLSTQSATTREAIDLARKQAATDMALLNLARQKEAVAFGRDAPWLDAAQHAAILAELSSGRSRLIKVSFPMGVLGSTPPSALVISRLGQVPTGPSWTTRDIWLAPADNTVPGRSVFTLLTGSDIGEGERASVSALTGAPISGAVVPADAVVLSEGQAWCYVLARSGVFVRTPLDLSWPVKGGYFVTHDIHPGGASGCTGRKPSSRART
jgi:hypothetical protein